MNKYLESSQVKVYPSAFRSSEIDLEASRFTEGSITKLVKAPLFKESFVKIENNGSMTLVLGGYIFTIIDPIINIKSLFSNQPESIYAFIVSKVITSTNDNIPLTMLVNIENESSTLDDTSMFKALAFSDTKPSEENYPLQIKVLEWSETLNDYKVSSESKLILDSIQIKDNLSGDKSIRELFKTDELYVLGQKTPSGKTYGLKIDSNGLIQKNNLEYSDPKLTDDDENYSYLTGITVTNDGKVSTTRYTLPDAGANTKGLVNTDNQEFSGIKTFNNGIKTSSISSSGSVNITTGSGEALQYNGWEVATRKYMQDSGISATAKKADALNSFNSYWIDSSSHYIEVYREYNSIDLSIARKLYNHYVYLVLEQIDTVDGYHRFYSFGIHYIPALYNGGKVRVYLSEVNSYLTGNNFIELECTESAITSMKFYADNQFLSGSTPGKLHYLIIK